RALRGEASLLNSTVRAGRKEASYSSRRPQKEASYSYRLPSHKKMMGPLRRRLASAQRDRRAPIVVERRWRVDSAASSARLRHLTRLGMGRTRGTGFNACCPQCWVG
ncbi:MAG TPA: hypothetical protein VJ828_10110, partial [Lacipirellulaceae bacterium]|nr:hypothetical protein [Lacipirellulaceae bacterium]